MSRRALIATAAAVVLFVLSAALHQPLQSRRPQPPRPAGEELQDTPPIVSFTTIALGGFRGILADILWLRVSHLQREGQYFELVQLSEWITTLEPKFTPAWSFHAWNLAYNISVMMNDPEDRWRWVRHGIELLRDRGIVYNPSSDTLYRDLGWLFQHKLGATYDSAHLYYKRQWAREMDLLMPGGRPAFDRWARLPDSRPALLEDAAMRRHVESLRDAGIDPFRLTGEKGLLGSQVPDELRSSAARSTLLAFVRRDVLRRDYRLMPDAMRNLEAELGPLDWRLPQTHAAYWATRGLEVAEGFGSVALHRMRYQSLADAYLNGQRIALPGGGVLLAPDLSLYQPAETAFARAVQAHPDQETFHDARAGFLQTAVTEWLKADNPRQARVVYRQLLDLYPEKVGAPSFRDVVLTRLLRGNAPTPEAIRNLLSDLRRQRDLWQQLGHAERADGFSGLINLVQSAGRPSAPSPVDQ